jgi:beta-aspartyl-peptidase (threonine type)
MKPAIIVHGGAGKWHSSRQKRGVKGVKQAVEKAYETLKRDGTAIQAVEAAVMMMEDNEVFNAGLGSTLCLTKHIEMEASIMDGKTLSAGASALLNEIKNPIQLARIIMENTDHIFVVGKGAHRLAEAFNLECRNPATTLTHSEKHSGAS